MEGAVFRFAEALGTRAARNLFKKKGLQRVLHTSSTEVPGKEVCCEPYATRGQTQNCIPSQA